MAFNFINLLPIINAKQTKNKCFGFIILSEQSFNAFDGMNRDTIDVRQLTAY